MEKTRKHYTAEEKVCHLETRRCLKGCEQRFRPRHARQIVRLPEGNQAEVLEAIRREALSTAELAAWRICGSDAPNGASNSTCCSIRAKRYRRPREHSPQCVIRD